MLLLPCVVQVVVNYGQALLHWSCSLLGRTCTWYESQCFCIGLCSTSYFLFLLVWWLVRAVCALGGVKKKLVRQVITWHTLYGHARYKKKRIAENILWQEMDEGTGKVLTKRNIDTAILPFTASRVLVNSVTRTWRCMWKLLNGFMRLCSSSLMHSTRYKPGCLLSLAMEFHVPLFCPPSTFHILCSSECSISGSVLLFTTDYGLLSPYFSGLQCHETTIWSP